MSKIYEQYLTRKREQLRAKEAEKRRREWTFVNTQSGWRTLSELDRERELESRDEDSGLTDAELAAVCAGPSPLLRR